MPSAPVEIPIIIPPGVILDDTTFDVGSTGWTDTDLIRFWRGLPQVVGGWESLVATQLTGVCRKAFSWSDNAGSLNIAFGTHSNLEVWIGGALFDITPSQALGYGFIPVTAPGSGYTAPTLTFPTATSPYVQASGSVYVEGGEILGIVISYPGLYPAGTTLTAPTISDSTGSGATLGTPIAVGWTPGNIDGTGGSGFGTGAFGEGAYGQPSTQTNFPMTWSLDSYGQELVACPRGQSIFMWSNNTSSPAQLIDNAPPEVTYALVANTRQIMALGCSDLTTGVFNPRAIRFTDIEAPTVWEPTAINLYAGQFIIEGSGYLVAGCCVGNYLFVWTDNALYLGTYTGTSTQPWEFEQIGENCGLIGPNAFCVIAEQTAFWMGNNNQFWMCTLGGTPSMLEAGIAATLFDNISAAQQAKVVVSSCAQFAEIRFDYPDARDGTNENSRYFLYNTIDNCWAVGYSMPRTAYVDAGPSPLPIGVDRAGDIYWQESGNSANGAPIAPYAQTGDMYLGEQIMQVQGMWPDVQNQIGNMTLTIETQLYPQDSLYTWPPNNMTPAQSRVDFQASGRIVRARYSSNSSPSYWRIGKPVYEVVQTGKR